MTELISLAYLLTACVATACLTRATTPGVKMLVPIALVGAVWPIAAACVVIYVAYDYAMQFRDKDDAPEA